MGALAGRADVMEVMNPLAETLRFPHSGTFSANPMTMTAGLTAMRLYDRAAVDRLNALTLRAVEGIRGAIEAAGTAACVTGSGSMFRVHFRETPPKNYREAYSTDAEAQRRELLRESMRRGCSERSRRLKPAAREKNGARGPNLGPVGGLACAAVLAWKES